MKRPPNVNDTTVPRMKGTLFAISGYIDTPGYLTRADLSRLAADGHEIGGHSVLHADLARVDPAEARREICMDRTNLQAWGLHPTSFAYPYSGQDGSLAELAQDCGYNNARTLGNLRSNKGCNLCPQSESMPPADPYEIRTPGEVDPSWTLDDLKAQVLDTERAGGGWVPLVFHRVCDDCSSIGIRPDVLDAFAGWLHDRSSPTMQVRTIGSVIGGSERSTPGESFGSPADVPPNALPNPGFENTGPDGKPACWTLAQNGQNDASMAAPTGPGGRTLSLTVQNWASGDAKVLPTMDLGACSPAAAERTAYVLAARYRADVPAQFSLYTRDAVGRWTYWTSSPFLDAAPGWSPVQWTTPLTPAGTTGLSVGLGLTGNGTVGVDDYRMTAIGAAAGRSSMIGPWGVAAVGLILVGVWCLLGGRVLALVARVRGKVRVAEPEPIPGPEPMAEPEPAVDVEPQPARSTSGT